PSPCSSPRLSFLARRHPPRPPLSPYTTLFRSHLAVTVTRQPLQRTQGRRGGREPQRLDRRHPQLARFPPEKPPELRVAAVEALRSEEHTSELQSRFDLVCRLLLEKKKTRQDDR